MFKMIKLEGICMAKLEKPTEDSRQVPQIYFPLNYRNNG